MKRKTFIMLSASSVLAATIPLALRWEELAGWGSPYAQPRLLSLVMNRRSIRSLGQSYVRLFPDESNYNVLFRLLTDEKSGVARLNESDTRGIRSGMEKKVNEDFQNGQTLMIDGWILSVTEARQCALYFLIQS